MSHSSLSHRRMVSLWFGFLARVTSEKMVPYNIHSPLQYHSTCT
jgi:hypothetical protein